MKLMLSCISVLLLFSKNLLSADFNFEKLPIGTKISVMNIGEIIPAIKGTPFGGVELKDIYAQAIAESAVSPAYIELAGSIDIKGLFLPGMTEEQKSNLMMAARFFVNQEEVTKKIKGATTQASGSIQGISKKVESAAESLAPKSLEQQREEYKEQMGEAWGTDTFLDQKSSVVLEKEIVLVAINEPEGPGLLSIPRESRVLEPSPFEPEEIPDVLDWVEEFKRTKAREQEAEQKSLEQPQGSEPVKKTQRSVPTTDVIDAFTGKKEHVELKNIEGKPFWVGVEGENKGKIFVRLNVSKEGGGFIDQGQVFVDLTVGFYRKNGPSLSSIMNSAKNQLSRDLIKKKLQALKDAYIRPEENISRNLSQNPEYVVLSRNNGYVKKSVIDKLGMLPAEVNLYMQYPAALDYIERGDTKILSTDHLLDALGAKIESHSVFPKEQPRDVRKIKTKEGFEVPLLSQGHYDSRGGLNFEGLEGGLLKITDQASGASDYFMIDIFEHVSADQIKKALAAKHSSKDGTISDPDVLEYTAAVKAGDKGALKRFEELKEQRRVKEEKKQAREQKIKQAKEAISQTMQTAKEALSKKLKMAAQKLNTLGGKIFGKKDSLLGSAFFSIILNTPNYKPFASLPLGQLKMDVPFVRDFEIKEASLGMYLNPAHKLYSIFLEGQAKIGNMPLQSRVLYNQEAGNTGVVLQIGLNDNWKFSDTFPDLKMLDFLQINKAFLYLSTIRYVDYAIDTNIVASGSTPPPYDQTKNEYLSELELIPMKRGDWKEVAVPATSAAQQKEGQSSEVAVTRYNPQKLPSKSEPLRETRSQEELKKSPATTSEYGRPSVGLASGLEIRKGLSMYGEINLRKLFPFIEQTKLKNIVGLERVSLYGTLPFNIATNPESLLLGAGLPDLIKIPASGPLRSGGFWYEFRLDANRIPESSIVIALTFLPSSKDEPLTFTSRLSAGVETAKVAFTMEGFWNNVLGVAGLSIGDVALQLDVNYILFFSTGMPAGIGLAGALKLGSPQSPKKVDIKALIDVVHPEQLVIQGKVDGELAIRDVLETAKTLAMNVAQQTVGQAKPAGDVLKKIDSDFSKIMSAPGFSDFLSLSLKDAEIKVAPQTVRVGEFIITQGLTLKGELNILGQRAGLNCNISQSGVTAEGFISPIEIGNVFKLHGVVGDSRPGLPKDAAYCSLALNFLDQHYYVSGEVEILGIKRTIQIKLDKDGFVFHVDGKVFDLFEASLDASTRGSIKNPDFYVKAHMKNDFFNFLSENVSKQIKESIAATSKDFEKARGDVAKLDNDIADFGKKIQERKERINWLNRNSLEGFKNTAEIIKVGLEITGFEIAQKGAIASREVAYGVLKGVEGAMGISGELVSNILSTPGNIVNVQEASFESSLQEIAKGVMPLMKMKVTLFGKTFDFSFQFDFRNKESALASVALVSKELLKLIGK